MRVLRNPRDLVSRAVRAPPRPDRIGGGARSAMVSRAGRSSGGSVTLPRYDVPRFPGRGDGSMLSRFRRPSSMTRLALPRRRIPSLRRPLCRAPERAARPPRLRPPAPTPAVTRKARRTPRWPHALSGSRSQRGALARGGAPKADAPAGEEGTEQVRGVRGGPYGPDRSGRG